MTTITTDNFRRIEADTTGLEVTCTASGVKMPVALNPDERRTLAAALTADQGGQWTRDDLPDKSDVYAAYVGRLAVTQGPEGVLDAIVDHLNAHHPKPDAAMVPARPITRADLPDLHPWLTEGAIDQVIEHINDRGGLGIDAREPLERAERERDAAVERADEWQQKAQRYINKFNRARNFNVEMKARADIEKALRECTNDVFASHAYPHMADAVCDLFGIEAEQAVDPIEAKVTTRHPEHYRLVNEADGSEWRMTRDGSWVAADSVGQEASSDE